MAATNKRVQEIFNRYGFDIDPTQKIYDMSVSQKQTVEIVKVLYRGADVLILDEPTAVLTPQETDKLFQVLRNMRADGKAIIIITHKLHEVMALSDKVAVLRKGKYIGTVNTAETNPQAVTRLMVGRAVALNIDRPRYENPVPRLAVQHLTCLDAEGVEKLDDVTFTAMGGEILGIAGIAGSGQKELLRGHRGPASCGLRRVHRLRPGRRPARARDHRQNADADEKGGRRPRLRPGRPARHGPGRFHGHDGQHDAPLLAQGQERLCQPQGPERVGPASLERAGGRHAERGLSCPAAVRRQRAEGACRPWDRVQPLGWSERLRRAWTRHQYLLYQSPTS
ncbi:MAG: ATP-binding cassette domain-containing protein [Oscillospiraceae bacterium]